MARPSTCSILPAFFHRNSIVPIDCLVVDCLRSSSESPKLGKARRNHSMRSRGSKSFRFLQIISAANKQYAGARAPDRQQAAEATAALDTCIPLCSFRRFAAFYAAACILLRCFAAFAAALVLVISQLFAEILVLFVGRRYYLRSMAALAASLNCCVGNSLDKVSWRLILRTVSFRNFF